MKKQLEKGFALLTASVLALSLTACSSNQVTETTTAPGIVQEQTEEPVETTEKENQVTSIVTKEDITIQEELESSADSEHVYVADGESGSLSNVQVTKTGDSDAGDEADFYGDNAAIFATNGAALDLTEMVIETSGTHANAVFSYGEGTTVNISDSVIETDGNCSGGLMTTGGGTMNASNLNIHTTGNSSAAIRSDRGGGTVTVEGGQYITDGTGSPVIYSTADITVSDAYMESTASQGVVVEGKNSVTLNDVEFVADNNKKNGNHSDWYQAVMIYQSMSGDADEGLATFSMTDGSLTNKNGDVFFVNNTVATISLENVAITNEDSEGVFLRAAAAGWGTEGSNGGKVELHLKNQELEGDMIVDEVSSLNLYLEGSTNYVGTVNGDNTGSVYVEIEEGATWTLTGDSYVDALTCSAGSIQLNGHKLYVNGEEYQEGTASQGEALTLKQESSGAASGGQPGEGGPMGGGTPPEGGPGNGGTPPEKPDGSAPGAPPEKP